ncbi:MAG: ATP-binding protein, partial [Nocardioidaceae bacterium]
MPIDAELRLSGDAIAVRRARRFVRELLIDAPEDLVNDAELTVSELVTNAVLHTESDVRLRLRHAGSGVRIDVYDDSGSTPLPADVGSEATTGRGLALVSSLATTWGVEPQRVGKIIWCELGEVDDPPPGRSAHSRANDPSARAASLASTPGPTELSDDQERFVDVDLGDVPTELLAAAKEHLDNLVRELELADLGASSGVTQAIPADMIELIDNVVGQFAHVRRAVKEQALEALAEGHERTTLRLFVPVGTADVAESYLAALEQADRFAKAVRLITLATPPQHRAFRRWYVHALVSQLRAAERGEEAPPRKSFEQHLLDELDAVATAQQATEMLATRLSHLQELTTE